MRFFDRILAFATKGIKPELSSVPGYAAYRDAYGEAFPTEIYGDFTTTNIRGRSFALHYPTAYRCIVMIANEASRYKMQVVHRETGKPAELTRMNAPGRLAALIRRGLDGEYPNRNLINAMCIDLATGGESFLVIHGSYAEPTNLELMSPDGASIQRSSNGMLYFTLQSNVTRQTHNYPANAVVHPILNSFLTSEYGRNRGVGPLDSLLRTISTGKAGDDYVRREFSGDSLQAKYAYLSTQPLTTEQVQDIKAAFRAGLRSQGLIVLPNMGDPAEGEGSDLKALTNSNLGQSKGLKELRDFQVEETARAFGTPLALLSVKGSQWGSGLLELKRHFLLFGVRPYMEAIEAALTYSLLRRTDYEVKFNLPPLLAADGDIEHVTKAWAIIGDGSQVVSKNEYREWMGLPKLPGAKNNKVSDLPSATDQRKAAEDNDAKPTPAKENSNGADE